MSGVEITIKKKKRTRVNYFYHITFSKGKEGRKEEREGGRGRDKGRDGGREERERKREGGKIETKKA